jgi:hypothetical protein
VGVQQLAAAHPLEINITTQKLFHSHKATN